MKARVALAAIGLVIAGVALRDVDVRALAGALAGIQPLLALAAAVLVIGAKIGAKAVRSQVLLAASARRLGLPAPSFATTLRLLVASHTAGQLAWGPLGFTVRTLALRDAGMPLRSIARVHVEERLAEAVGIAALATVALVIGGMGASWVGRAMVVALGVLAGLALLGAVVLAASARARATAARYVDDGRALGLASGWALASSVADLAILWIAARAAGATLDAPTTLMAFLVLVGAGTVPLTPAQVGVQESALVVVFTASGVAAPVALSAALAYRVVHVLPLLGVGVPLLVRRPSADHPPAVHST